MGLPKVRLAIVSEWDCQNAADWSGTPYYMAKAISAVLGSHVVIRHPPFERLSGTVDQRLRTIGAYVSAHLDAEQITVAIFQGTAGLPYCDVECTRILWHDSTWRGLLTPYQVDFKRFTVQWPALHRWDESALRGADQIYFASDWARSVATEYGAVADGSGVLPFGPNIDHVPSAAEVTERVDQDDFSECRLLFVGKDYRRKGLERAIEVVNEINDRGQKATLTVIGVGSESSPASSDHVTYLGTLDKRIPADCEAYVSHLRRSHFLIHPATFECFGIAVLEAQAYGVPALTTPTGGLPSVVEDGLTGYLLPLEEFSRAAVTAAIELHSDRAMYKKMASAAVERVNARYNWQQSAATLLAQMPSGVDTRRHRVDQAGLCSSHP